MKQLCFFLTFRRANNRDADQTERMHRLVCAFVVRLQQSDFLAISPYGSVNAVQCVL